MRSIVTAVFVVGFALAGTTGPVFARGCVKGAVVGGVAGHVAGHHTKTGALAGCAVGHHEANKKAENSSQQAANNPSDQKH